MLHSYTFAVERYIDTNGKHVLSEWLETLRDEQAVVRITRRLVRLMSGNFGDHKPVDESVWELRIDHGPGYRIYYAIAGKTIILLLCGGDKRTQNKDIKCAIEYWKEYQRRKI